MFNLRRLFVIKNYKNVLLKPNQIDASNAVRSFTVANSILNNKYKKYNYQYENYREYKNFGHKPEPTPNITLFFHSFILFSFLAAVFDLKG